MAIKKIILTRERLPLKDKTIRDGKSYCVMRDRICTLPKGGGNDASRPSVIAKKKKNPYLEFDE